MGDQPHRTKPNDPRRIEFRAFDVRVADDGAGFSGYASTSWHVDSYGTAFAPGCWTKTLAERADKVLVLWQHDPYLPIGRPTAMSQDGTGLAVTAKITEATQYGRDAMALLRDGVPLGLSVGFRTIRERPATEHDPILLDGAPEWVKSNPLSAYIIDEAKLYEFSAVSFPANDFAEIAVVRSAAESDALAMLLADIRAGRLPDAHRSLVDQLVAAWQAAPEGSAPPRTDATARRNRDVDLALAVARWGQYRENAA